jgi:hypothetical protein
MAGWERADLLGQLGDGHGLAIGLVENDLFGLAGDQPSAADVGPGITSGGMQMRDTVAGKARTIPGLDRSQ